MSLSGHQSAKMKNDEWLTPPEILRALGPFDLDPCAPIARPWETAATHYTAEDDGLSKPWAGRVWCNPPFGREASVLACINYEMRHVRGMTIDPRTADAFRILDEFTTRPTR